MSRRTRKRTREERCVRRQREEASLLVVEGPVRSWRGALGGSHRGGQGVGGIMQTVLIAIHGAVAHLYVDGLLVQTSASGTFQELPVGKEGHVLYAGVLRDDVEMCTELSGYPEDAWISPPKMLEGSGPTSGF